MNTPAEQLDFWESLGKLHDTYGLPADIIWCKLRDAERLPKCRDGLPMSGDEFAKGIKQATAFLQGGGWRKVFEFINSRDYLLTNQV